MKHVLHFLGIALVLGIIGVVALYLWATHFFRGIRF